PDSSVKKGRVLFGEKESCLPIILILFGAFALRAVLAGFITGFYFDVNCFTFWGARAADIPLANFYETWCDYPPGYIYVLALMSKIASGLGLTGGTAAHMFVIKLPAILCDLFAAYAVFRLAKKRMTKATAYVVTCFVAFSPVMAFISGAWAQIDSVLSILLFASAFLLCDRKIVWAGLVYGISIAVKPQALMVGPIYALVYIMYIIDAKSNKERLNIFLKTLAAVGSAVGMILLAFIPFFPIKGGEGLFDYAGRLVTEIYNKYFSTLGGYDYATIEAYNLFGLCGANWRPSGEMFILGLSYKQFGTLMMGISVVASWVLYIIGRKKSKYCIFLVMAFLLSSLFIFGHYMHERYLAPVLLLTVIAMCGYGDRRLFIAFAAFSAGLFVNVLGAYTIILPIVDGNAMRAGWGDNYTAFIRMGSVINLLAYIFFTYACVSLTAGNKIWGTAMPEPLKKSKNIKK
ncbi:MAG: hypothetical protein IJO48_02015, partial [Clostridia bacterium]|nr:hypothetical protein [Clostridia bacterium]